MDRVRHSQRAAVLINGDDVYEDMFGAASALSEVASLAGFATTVGVGMERFREPQEREAEVYILYTATGVFTPEEQAGLASRVESGAGLVALHASNVFATNEGAVARGYETAFGLIGSRYVSHGPEPHESEFRVVVNRGHRITEGIADFSIVHEHYVLDVRQYGGGRVCYLQLGHDMRVWDEPAVRTILLRSLLWSTCVSGDYAYVRSGQVPSERQCAGEASSNGLRGGVGE